MLRSRKQEFHLQESSDDRKDLESPEQFPVGSRGYVRALQCGQRLAGRFAALGPTLGAKIEVLQNPGYGPLLVAVRGTRLAIGRGQATKVLVGEMGDERPS
jgi:Fe2+ transport system protein FeoA